MVLQRDASINIWGRADPGEIVSVDFQGHKTKAHTDRGGRWSVALGPYPAGGPYAMTITGKNSIAFNDILLGDVWFASGQSNMEFTVGAFGGYPGVGGAEEALARARLPQLRLFTADRAVALEPKDDVVSDGWQTANAQTVGRFSAVAYFFGLELHARYQVPIGLVQSAWGGTLAEAWMSRKALTPFREIKTQTAAPDVEARLYYETLQPLRRTWYRQHVADDRGRIGERDVWAEPEFDASGWPILELPRPLQAVLGDPGGFLGGFGGVVWLRKEIAVLGQSGDCDWVLNLGTEVARDDAVFWNGSLIGKTTGGNDRIPRSYLVPKPLVRAGRNVIAIRLVGGSRFGFGDAPVGVFGSADALRIQTCSGTIPLSGVWAYQPGADLQDFPVIDAGILRRYALNVPPTTLFNGMVHPLSSYRIKGVIWYQGEANALERRSSQYRTLFPALIEDWRREWRDDFPFLFVQLAGFAAIGPACCEGAKGTEWVGLRGLREEWVGLREAQDRALHVPRTGMATGIDIGNAVDIHPRDKQGIGHRLALAAFKVAYGESDVVDSGPRYQSMRIEGRRIRIHFSSLGSGLLIKDEYQLVHGFEIAGADHEFYPAGALVDGEDILVFSKFVEKPEAVRYDWCSMPDGNVYNLEGLPALPFRTDDAR